MHRLTTNGRHRFAANAAKCFSKFVELVQKYPQFKVHLTDKGKGKPPLDYLKAVEEGLREHGKDIHSMGTNALRSPKDWEMIPAWKKREAYIAVGRYLNGKFGYEQWDHFRYQDYVDRMVLSLTFYRRHLPLSNGKSKVLKMEPPKQWLSPVVYKSRGRKPNKQKQPTPALVAEENPQDEGPSQVLELNDEGEFVPVVADGGKK